MDLSY